MMHKNLTHFNENSHTGSESFETDLNKNTTREKGYWLICKDCDGQGRKRQKLRKKARLKYQRAQDKFEKTKSGIAPVQPKGQRYACENCKGSGLVSSGVPPMVDIKKYPHIAIIGGGIGGVALAVACLHRGIPFTLYERDANFTDRSQGYGLTLQQASIAMMALGISNLKDGLISTRHVVHTTEGKIIGEWGLRKWGRSAVKSTAKRTNIHIPRQALRKALLEQLGDQDNVQWAHQLIDLKECAHGGMSMSFMVAGKLKNAKADLVVGADGIRSSVRKIVFGEKSTPLKYLGCIVILGICALEDLNGLENTLLDAATVFQTANGNERIYMMPYTSDSIMWQLSFPISEKAAKALSVQGPKALKNEALQRLQWHAPIPQVITATAETKISGYPVYDRALLSPELLEKNANVTLIGDAAHPMSPFKGQGANQALLDALSLARVLAKNCKPQVLWKESGLRKSVLTEFEEEMLARSATKVKASAEAARVLHTEEMLQEGDISRGRDRAQ